MIALRILAALLALLFAVTAFSNWRTVVIYRRTGRSPSWIPVIGGLSGMLAALLISEARAWWWLPLLLDWGTVPGIAYSLWRIWRDRGNDAAPPYR